MSLSAQEAFLSVGPSLAWNCLTGRRMDKTLGFFCLSFSLSSLSLYVLFCVFCLLGCFFLVEAGELYGWGPGLPRLLKSHRHPTGTRKEASALPLSPSSRSSSFPETQREERAKKKKKKGERQAERDEDSSSSFSSSLSSGGLTVAGQSRRTRKTRQTSGEREKEEKHEEEQTQEGGGKKVSCLRDESERKKDWLEQTRTGEEEEVLSDGRQRGDEEGLRRPIKISRGSLFRQGGRDLLLVRDVACGPLGILVLVEKKQEKGKGETHRLRKPKELEKLS